MKTVTKNKTEKRQRTYSIRASVANKIDRARSEVRLTTTQFLDVMVNHWNTLDPVEQMELIRQTPDK